MSDPPTPMDLFVWQPVVLAGNLNARRFQCPAVSCNSYGCCLLHLGVYQRANSQKAVECMEGLSLGVIFC